MSREGLLPMWLAMKEAEERTKEQTLAVGSRCVSSHSPNRCSREDKGTGAEREASGWLIASR